MFVNKELQAHLEESSVIKTQSAIIAEWNMNIPTNISKIGNYRYRPTGESKFAQLPSTFDITDAGGYYTGATDADIVIDGGVDDDESPISLKATKDKIKLLYSLEDCFKQFRPRSGINKARFFKGSYIHHANVNMADRPRYYMPDKNDVFKYWSSYRTEDNAEYGISNKTANGQNIIEDAAPFVVYKNQVPTNRIVIKMQTHVGTVGLETSDPLYGTSNKKTPKKWKVQHLKGTSWTDAISFDSDSTRTDGSEVIGPDGYIELSYGLKIPQKYRSSFIYADTLASTILLPETNVNGYAYLIVSNTNDLGTFYIWVNDKYETFDPEYGWQLMDESIDRLTNFVTDLTSPPQYISRSNNSIRYREFEYINGIRIVVDSMNKKDSAFELIELSPRLSVNFTDRVMSFSVNKKASDLGVSGMPVGQLLVSTGKLSVFDYDNAFDEANENSIVKDHIARHIQFKFYEIVSDVGGYDYFVPLKTLYSDSFPQVSNSNRTVDISLRDMFFYLESTIAPQMLMTNVSVSSAVSLLLDSVGFANYTFKRVENEPEVIIPFFFIPPDSSVAKILEQLAISTQTAMFFDEYNNFVTMSKNFIMPTTTQRATDIVLYGTTDQYKNGIIENAPTQKKLANIIDLSEQSSQVYNDGAINYTTRYIQRSVGSIKQASLIDKDKTWIYKPVLLWEVAGTQNTKSVNGEVGNQSRYTLAAVALNSDLSADVPKVVNNQIVNNVLDFGESVYWLTRYNGYFYSNGEIIKYDAIQYSVPSYGNVWITDVLEYDNYFSKLPFNAKMYPTGLVRIYSEPNYEEVSGVTRLKNGYMAKHGRGQFGTSIVAHSAGLADNWTSNSYVNGCAMMSERIFTPETQPLPQSSTGLAVGPAGTSSFVNRGTPPVSTPESSKNVSLGSTRNGIIKNFLSTTYVDQLTVNAMKSTRSGTIQSSALVINGPSLTTSPSPQDFISYVYKPLENRFKHFGTRLRIIGKIENNDLRGQSATGNSTYYVVPGKTPDKSITISGGSAGMAVLLNPETNNGYYFEIAALGVSDITNNTDANVNNVFFYKIMKDSNGNAVPVKLWEGLSKIIVDDGNFTGQYRMAGEENPTVYDLSVEYQDIGNARRFYLYINNMLVKTVDDSSPLPTYNNMALFVRGSARAMFENVFALTNNYSQNTTFKLDTPVNSIFGVDELDASGSFRKYSMSGIVQGTYLSGISSAESPKYNIYFDEFGTIMREAAAFNIRYDKAYPALYAKMSPTFNRIKGYTVSGFRAGAYGAEFLIFNATDTALSLDETTGNYLRIQGVTFTQQSQHSLKVDDFFSKNSSLSDPQIENNTVVVSPFKSKKDYEDIKLSRMTYGKKDFTLDVPYIQTQDAANDLMKWIISKIMKPKKSLGLKIFANPTIQLGDIVSIEYVQDGINRGGSNRYVVYSIEYSKTKSGPEMTINVSEVI